MSATRKAKRRYGEKSYAPKVLVQRLREYAAATRRAAFVRHGDLGHFSAERHETRTHGQALGAIAALYSTGCITNAQYDRAFKRLERINHAKVTRRPFVELRAAA